MTISDVVPGVRHAGTNTSGTDTEVLARVPRESRCHATREAIHHPHPLEHAPRNLSAKFGFLGNTDPSSPLLRCRHRCVTSSCPRPPGRPCLARPTECAWRPLFAVSSTPAVTGGLGSWASASDCSPNHMPGGATRARRHGTHPGQQPLRALHHSLRWWRLLLAQETRRDRHCRAS